jgi:hypothetical protein
MLRGFKHLPPRTTVVWFETNEDRYKRLHRVLTRIPPVQLTTQQSKIAATQVAPPQETFVQR